jgi:hypothetical protein
VKHALSTLHSAYHAKRTLIIQFLMFQMENVLLMIKSNVMELKVQDFSLILLRANAQFVMDYVRLVKEVRIFAHLAGNSNLITLLTSCMRLVLMFAD